MRLRELRKRFEERLRAAGVPDPSFDASSLLCEALNVDMAGLLARLGDEAPQDAAARLEESIKRRAAREPLQHILGRAYFMGLSFQVDRHVLIPRPETETLTELVLQENPNKGLEILDLCTGSGCIGISLKQLGGYQRVLCSDVSTEALALAEKNADDICGAGCGPEFRQSDMFSCISECFDVIVSNPPYIRREEIIKLEPEVREGDPLIALDGGWDGLHFYRILAAEARQHLKPEGRLYMEMGRDQGESLENLFHDAGFQNIQIIKDLAGLPRICRVC